MYIYTERKCLIYHEAIGALVITERAHRQDINVWVCSYIFVYIKHVDVIIYVSQNAKAGNVFETTCSSKKLNIVCR